MLNYKFKNEKLLDLALTQSGVNADCNNERLEFIGDRVLGLSVASLLYDMFPNETEGDLAKRHAVLVSTDTLAHVAKQFELDKYVKHGHMTGGKIDHVLADAMEAVLGAIFLDADFNTVKDIIVSIWSELASAEVTVPKDAKSALQEFVQKNSNGVLPEYEYSEPVGASHNPVFSVKVSALGKSAIGTGNSKKNASIMAAENLLKKLDL